MRDRLDTVLGSFIDGAQALVGAPGLGFAGPLEPDPQSMLEAGAEGVERAVASATRAARIFRDKPLHIRIEHLEKGAAAIEQARDALVELICEDVGKPIRPARFEIGRGVEMLRSCASALSHLGTETIPLDATPSGEGCFGFTRRLPYGVVGAITPFNAPVNLLIQKVGPAVAAGNTVIAKPAPAGLRTALAVALLLSEAGWPAGLFNVLSGDRETAAALAGHAGVSAVSFTGSTAGGDALARAAGAKKFVAELGSNAANIVFADADIATAARKIAAASFEASGQQCISAQRVIVHADVVEPFLEQFVAAARALKVGAVDDPATDIGPMVTLASAERVMAMAEDARARGARVMLEPRRDGATVTPGIFADVSPEALLWREEVFGPMAVVVPFRSDDEALALANDSEFGLQGAIFTQELTRALAFSRAFEVGSLWINEASRFRLDTYPFGGVKRSGVGREGVRYAIEELSQIQFVGIRG